MTILRGMARAALICALVLALAPAAVAQSGGSFKDTVSGTADKVGGYLDDSAVTTAIKGKFLAQKGLDSLDLRVETTKGVVTLRGQVLRKDQMDLAVKIARETDGVRAVVNKISVMP